LEIDITAINEGRGAPATSLLLVPDEQMDGDAPLRMLCDVLAIILRRSILTLPFEFGGCDEVILVLELRAMARLVQRGQQKDVPWAPNETGIPNRGRELESKERWDLLSRVRAPELQFARPLTQWSQMPIGPAQLESDCVTGAR
jgi:hypothetical protein